MQGCALTWLVAQAVGGDELIPILLFVVSRHPQLHGTYTAHSLASLCCIRTHGLHMYTLYADRYGVYQSVFTLRRVLALAMALACRSCTIGWALHHRLGPEAVTAPEHTTALLTGSWDHLLWSGIP